MSKINAQDRRETDRTAIIDMVYDLCKMVLPEGGELSAAAEHKIVALHHRLSVALDLDPDVDQI
jgi:hypothetical protein